MALQSQKKEALLAFREAGLIPLNFPSKEGKSLINFLKISWKNILKISQKYPK
jgi:histidine ammonia-lyase